MYKALVTSGCSFSLYDVGIIIVGVLHDLHMILAWF